MNKPAADSKTTSDDNGGSPSPQKLRIGHELADTTWRMTVPVVLFAFVGIFADLQFDTAPWLTLLGTVIGFYFAFQLVKKQINRG